MARQAIAFISFLCKAASFKVRRAPIDKPATKTVSTFSFNSKKDFSIPISIDTSAQQLISTKNLDKGYWKVELRWVQDSLEYYKESSFVIN